MTTSPSSPSRWPSSAVTPGRVAQVLQEASNQLGNAVALAHGMAGRSRAWSVAEALRSDADELALTQRAIRQLMEDLEHQVRAEVRQERVRLGLERPPAPGALTFHQEPAPDPADGERRRRDGLS